jgi:Tol biopolymer transport system component
MAQPFDAGKAQTTGDPVPITEQIGHPRDSPALFSTSQNGILVYESNSAQENAQLTWFDRSGKEGGTVGLPGFQRVQAISPDGATVAAERQDPTGGWDIWLHDIAHGSNSRFTFGPYMVSPVWSPDSSHIAFMSLRDGGTHVYQKATSGAAQDNVLDRDARVKFPTDWSRDGRFIIEGVQDPKTGRDIWVLPLFGDRKPFPYLHTEFNEGNPKVSPNVKWLAYESDESKTE